MIVEDQNYFVKRKGSRGTICTSDRGIGSGVQIRRYSPKCKCFSLKCRLSRALSSLHSYCSLSAGLHERSLIFASRLHHITHHDTDLSNQLVPVTGPAIDSPRSQFFPWLDVMLAVAASTMTI